jgi:hypothetical protein
MKDDFIKYKCYECGEIFKRYSGEINYTFDEKVFCTWNCKCRYKNRYLEENVDNQPAIYKSSGNLRSTKTAYRKPMCEKLCLRNSECVSLINTNKALIKRDKKNYTITFENNSYFIECNNKKEHNYQIVSIYNYKCGIRDVYKLERK